MKLGVYWNCLNKCWKISVINIMLFNYTNLETIAKSSLTKPTRVIVVWITCTLRWHISKNEKPGKSVIWALHYYTIIQCILLIHIEWKLHWSYPIHSYPYRAWWKKAISFSSPTHLQHTPIVSTANLCLRNNPRNIVGLVFISILYYVSQEVA